MSEHLLNWTPIHVPSTTPSQSAHFRTPCSTSTYERVGYTAKIQQETYSMAQYVPGVRLTRKHIFRFLVWRQKWEKMTELTPVHVLQHTYATSADSSLDCLRSATNSTRAFSVSSFELYSSACRPTYATHLDYKGVIRSNWTQLNQLGKLGALITASCVRWQLQSHFLKLAFNLYFISSILLTLEIRHWTVFYCTKYSIYHDYYFFSFLTKGKPLMAQKLQKVTQICLLLLLTARENVRLTNSTIIVMSIHLNRNWNWKKIPNLILKPHWSYSHRSSGMRAGMLHCRRCSLSQLIGQWLTFARTNGNPHDITHHQNEAIQKTNQRYKYRIPPTPPPFLMSCRSELNIYQRCV